MWHFQILWNCFDLILGLAVVLWLYSVIPWGLCLGDCTGMAIGCLGSTLSDHQLYGDMVVSVSYLNLSGLNIWMLLWKLLSSLYLFPAFAWLWALSSSLSFTVKSVVLITEVLLLDAPLVLKATTEIIFHIWLLWKAVRKLLYVLQHLLVQGDISVHCFTTLDAGRTQER